MLEFENTKKVKSVFTCPLKVHSGAVKNDKIVVSIFQFFMLHAEYKCTCIYIKMTLGHKIGNIINIINHTAYFE